MHISNIPKYIAIFTIRVYQHTLSPDHGFGRLFCSTCGCVFSPTCSEYTIFALKKYGFLKGITLGIKRIWRCRPQNGPAHDPLV